MESSSSRRHPPLQIALMVWALGAGLYLIGFFHRVAPAVITRELSTEFALTAAALGNLSALYFYTYVGMQIPTGVMVDHWGPRRVLTAGGVMAALGTLLFALSPGYFLVGCGRLMVGAGVGVAFVAMLKLITTWVHPSRFALISGLALATGGLGGVCAGVPLRIAVDALGWRTVMLGTAALTAGLAVATWVLMRDDPRSRGYLSYAEGAAGSAARQAGHTMLGGIASVLRVPNVWLIFVGCGAITGPVLAFGGLWGVPFLSSQYGMSTAQAALLNSLMLISWSVGSPLAGGLSDRLRRRKLPLLGGGALCVLMWALLIYVPGLPMPALVALLCGIGLASGVVVIGFAFCKESAPAALAGTASGIANMGNMLGGMIMQPAIGLLLDARWTGALNAGVRAYDFAAYSTGFSLMLAWLVTGLVAVAFAAETHARQRP